MEMVRTQCKNEQQPARDLTLGKPQGEGMRGRPKKRWCDETPKHLGKLRIDLVGDCKVEQNG